MALQGFTKSTCRAYLYQLMELARKFYRSTDELTERYRPVDVLFYGLDKHRTYDPKYLSHVGRRFM